MFTKPVKTNGFRRFFRPRWRPQTTQNRPKTGPRSSWIGFFDSSIFDRFGIDFGAVLASQMAPQGCAHFTQIGPGAVQDGLGIVLVRSFFRLVVRDRFFGRLGLLLGSFLAAPGVVLVLFRHFNSSIQPVNSSTRRFNSSTHQLINPWPFGTFLPGPADCALRD